MTIVNVNGKGVKSVISGENLETLLYYADRSPPGVIVEVGVYRGGSALMLSKLKRPLFLYDTFTGIPYAGALDTSNYVGKFGDTSAEAVQTLIPEATVVKGLFPDSLIPMPPIAFVHADADQYQSTKAILDTLPPLMVKGGMLLFDDFNQGGTEGCTKAVKESGFRYLTISGSNKGLIIV